MADQTSQALNGVAHVTTHGSRDFGQPSKIHHKFIGVLCEPSQSEMHQRLKIWVDELRKSTVERSRVPQDSSKQHPIHIVQHMKPRDNGLSLRHCQESNHFGELHSLGDIQIVGPGMVMGQCLPETLNTRRSPNELASKKLQNHGCFASAIAFLQTVVLFGNVQRGLGGVFGGDSKAIGGYAQGNGGEHSNRRNCYGPALPNRDTAVAQPPTMTQGIQELHLCSPPRWCRHSAMSLQSVEAIHG